MQGKQSELVTVSTTVDLPLDSFLPDDYIGDRTLKVNFYQRLAHLSTSEQVEAMTAEMTDRFGAPPLSVQNLITLVRLKVEASHLGFESIAIKDNEFVLTVKRTIVPNRIVLYRRFRNEARVQQGIIRIPKRLLGQNWLEQLQELLPAITATAASTA